MAEETVTGTVRGLFALEAGSRSVKTPLGAMIAETTLEVPAASSANSTFWIARLPSNARIHGLSRIAFDDLASTGSPTFDIGTFGVEGNVTTDDVDSLNDGIGVAAAAGTANVIKDIVNYGKRLWEFAGETADPGGFIDIKISLLDAATDTGGTVTATIVYTVD